MPNSLILLKTEDFSNSPEPKAIYPCLSVSESSGHKLYRLAFLVSDENQVAQKLLLSIGFKKKNISSGPSVDWTAFICKANGPIKALTSNSNASEEKKLETYLKVEYTGADEIIVPTKIEVVKTDLAPSLFAASAYCDLQGLDFGDMSLAWGTETGEDKVSLSWAVPLVSDETKVPKIKFEDRGLNSNNEWKGGVFKFGATHIQGDSGVSSPPGNRLELDGNELSLTTAAKKTAAISINRWVSFQLAASSALFSRRFSTDGDENPAHEFAVSPQDHEISLVAEFPLIMALADRSPTALSLLIPLLKKVDENDEGERKDLGFEFTIKIGAGFDFNAEPIAEWDDVEEQWEFSEQFWQAAESNVWPVSVKWKETKDKLNLGGFDWNLGDLVGENFNVQFTLRPFVQLLEQEVQEAIPCQIRNGALCVPVELGVKFGGLDLNLCLDLAFNTTSFRLQTNRLAFRLPSAAYCARNTVINLGIMALILPSRPPGNYLDAGSIDGYFDFEKREFVLFSAPGVNNPVVVLPGFQKDVFGELDKRLVFEMVPFDPDSWPRESPSKRPVFLRINEQGLSLNATAVISHNPTVVPEEQQTETQTNEQGNDEEVVVAKLPPIRIMPASKKGERKSEVVIINNTIRKAVLLGEIDVPGAKDLTAAVEVGMRQEKKGKPPVLHAEIDLETKNNKPIADLEIGNCLTLALDDMRARLEWSTGNNDWSLSVPVDASLILSRHVGDSGGLDDLRKANAIQVRNLDLMNLRDFDGEVTLPVPGVVRFKCLDDMFQISMTDLDVSWNLKDRKIELRCKLARVAFLNPGVLAVAIEAGGVHLIFEDYKRLRMENPESLGIEVAVGQGVRFRGLVSWVDDDRKRYFGAEGTLALTGMPEVSTVLRLGAGTKQNGQIVPDIVFYGSLDYEVTLFAGVVTKNFGAGIGLNNRLAGIPERPIAEDMLKNIDQVDPSKLSGWSFVERNGFYLSIVGSMIVSSNPGGNKTVNGYVATMALSIDIDLNVAAAIKLWIASSVEYVRRPENWSRPVMVGAVGIVPRELLFTAAIESRKNPAIEASDKLKKILNKGSVKMSFTLSPSLVDFHLKEISYRDSFVGIQMLYRGELRIAVFDWTLLVRTRQSITGRFDKSLRGRRGGFTCRGYIALGVEFGGILGKRGIAFYGIISAQISLHVSAWIRIKFLGWKKTFRLGSMTLELGLYGALGFDVDGGVGFVGKVSISVSICGYRLKISPSLKFREKVIHRVRRKVAAYERRLDSYRQKLLRRDYRKIALMDNRETWLHIALRGKGSEQNRNRIWSLLIPHRESEWFTPKFQKGESDGVPTPLYEIEPTQEWQKDVTFLNEVTSLTWRNGQNEEVALKMPWASSSEEGANNAESNTGFDMVKGVMIETCGDDSSDTPDCLRDYQIVQDPRVESSDREYWTDIDQALLPDYALPISMKSPDQILSSGEVPRDFNSNYGRLVNFLYWSQVSTKHKQFTDEDYLDGEDVEQARATVVHELLKNLEQVAAEDKESSGLEKNVWVCDQDGEKIGLIYSELADKFWTAPGDISVARGNVIRKAYVISLNDKSGSLRQTWQKEISKSFELHSPRQEYVVDKPVEEESENEKGRVVVRLPVSYSDSFFSEEIRTDKKTIPLEFKPSDDEADLFNLATVDSEPVLSDSEIQPARIVSVKVKVTANGKETKVEKHLGFFEATVFTERELDGVGAFKVESNGQYSFAPNANENRNVEIELEIKFELEEQPAFFDLFSHFEVWRRINGGPQKRVGDHSLPSINYLRNNGEEKPVAVIDPYIFSESFDTENRRIVQNGVTAESTVIEYRIRFIPVACPNPQDLRDSDSMFSDWKRVQLHVPKDDNFPTDLGLAFDFNDLVRSELKDKEAQWCQFAIVGIGDESVQLALTDEWSAVDGGLPQNAERRSFEIWVEEIPIPESGFYASARKDAEIRRRKDKGYLQDITAETHTITTFGKYLLDEIESVTGRPGLWRFRTRDRIFRKDGYRYRFFIRAKYQNELGDKAFGILRRMHLGISKPNSLDILQEESLWYKSALDPRRDEQQDLLEKFRANEVFALRKQGTHEDEYAIGTMALRFVDYVEWIDDQEIKTIAQILNDEFDDDLHQKLNVPIAISERPIGNSPILDHYKRYLGIEWQQRSWKYGGAEFQIADADDPYMNESFVCETAGLDSYRLAYQDFANDQGWKLTRLERESRIGKPATLDHDAISDPLRKQGDELEEWICSQTLHLGQTNPIQQKLKFYSRKVKGARGKGWLELGVAFSEFFRVLHEYERTSFNIGDETFALFKLKLEEQLKWWIVGCTSDVDEKIAGADSLDDLDSYADGLHRDLEALIQQVQEYDPEIERDRVDDSETETLDAVEQERIANAVVDSRKSKKLAAIIQRRIAIAEEIVTGEFDLSAQQVHMQVADPNPSGIAGAQDSDLEKRPREHFVEKLLKNLDASSTFTNKLMTAGVGRFEDEQAERLFKTLDELVDDVVTLKGAEPHSRRKQASELVTKSAGLSIALEMLKGQFAAKSWLLETRPHHQSSIGADEKGFKAVEVTKLAAFAGVKSDASITDQPKAPSIVGYLNFLERMGFAIDIAGVDSNGETLLQPDLLAAISDANLHQARFDETNSEGHNVHETISKGHNIYLVLPREHDSEYRGKFPDSSSTYADGESNQNGYFYVGNTFAKLVIVPKAFEEGILRLGTEVRGPVAPENQPGAIALRFLSTWLEIRGIDPGNDDSILKLYQSSCAALLASRNDNDSVASIRLAPVEFVSRFVPHVNGYAHVAWQLPDRRGHRFNISGRFVSRYEPLIRWAKGIHHKVKTGHSSQIRIYPQFTIPEIDRDLPQGIPVSALSGQEELDFIYRLPEAGVRSMLNRISMVRTGYQGCQLHFQHRLIDYDLKTFADVDLRWPSLLEQFKYNGHEFESELYPLVKAPLLDSRKRDVQLMRHEQQVTVDNTPFFYEIALSVTSEFQGELLTESDAAGIQTADKNLEVEKFQLLRSIRSDGEPAQVIDRPEFARRRPSMVAFRQPSVSLVNEAAETEVQHDEAVQAETPITATNVKIVLPLTRLFEMAAFQELGTSIPRDLKENRKVGGHEIRDEDLFVPFLGYHFFAKLDDKVEQRDKSERQKEIVFESLFDVVLPWHESHQKDSPIPRVSVRSDQLNEVKVDKFVYDKDEDGRLFPWIEIGIVFKKPISLNDLENLVMQVSCLGQRTSACHLRIED